MTDEINNNLTEIELDTLYVAIPAEYIPVYYYILILYAELGEEMLKDCKATCTKRNSKIIECYTMFNAAIAAYKTNKAKLARTLIEYIKNTLNSIYSSYSNNISFVLPVDANGNVNLFVDTSHDLPKFSIDPTLFEKLKEVFVTNAELNKDKAKVKVMLTEDYRTTTEWYSREKFNLGTSVVFINGIRYWIDEDDYSEIKDENNQGIGFRLNEGELSNDDEIYVKADIIDDDVQ